MCREWDVEVVRYVYDGAVQRCVMRCQLLFEPHLLLRVTNTNTPSTPGHSPLRSIQLTHVAAALR